MELIFFGFFINLLNIDKKKGMNFYFFASKKNFFNSKNKTSF